LFVRLEIPSQLDRHASLDHPARDAVGSTQNSIFVDVLGLAIQTLGEVRFG
jgi:hypothetical protein